MKMNRISQTAVAFALILAMRSSLLSQSQQPGTSSGDANEEISKGFELFQGGKYTEALASFTKVLETDAANTNALFFSALCHQRLREYAGEVECYDRLLKIEAKSCVAWSNRGVALTYLDRHSEAEDSFLQALRADANDPIVYLNRGTCRLRVGRYVEANADFTEAKKLGKTSPYALWIERIQRQLTGKDVPPKEWKPNVDAYHTDIDLSKPGRPLVAAGTGGERYRFQGTADAPFEYAPAFYVWQGAVLGDPNKGVLLDNGTKFRTVEIIGNAKTIRTGEVRGWVCVVDTTETVAAATPAGAPAAQPTQGEQRSTPSEGTQVTLSGVMTNTPAAIGIVGEGTDGRKAVVLDLRFDNKTKEKRVLSWTKELPQLRPAAGASVPCRAILIPNWLPTAGGVGEHATEIGLTKNDGYGAFQIIEDAFCSWVRLRDSKSRSGDHIAVPIAKLAIQVPPGKSVTAKMLFLAPSDLLKATVIVPDCEPRELVVDTQSGEKAGFILGCLRAALKAMDEYHPSLASDRARAICGVAGALVQVGAGTEGRQILSEILREKPRDNFARRYVAACYAGSGNTDDANATIDGITDQQCRVWARIGVAVALHPIGRVEQSTQAFSLAKRDAAAIDPSGAVPNPSQGVVRADAAGNRAMAERDISIAQAKLGLLEEAKLTASGIRHQGVRQVAESSIGIAEIKRAAVSGDLEKARQMAARIQEAYAAASAYREIAAAQAAQGDLAGAQATLARASEWAQRATPEFLSSRGPGNRGRFRDHPRTGR